MLLQSVLASSVSTCGGAGRVVLQQASPAPPVFFAGIVQEVPANSESRRLPPSPDHNVCPSHFELLNPRLFYAPSPGLSRDTKFACLYRE